MTKIFIRHDNHDLGDRINHVLARVSHLLGKPIQVHVIDSEVLLTGSVRSYFQKQLAQESLRGIAGLGTIRNQLRVTTTASSDARPLVVG